MDNRTNNTYQRDKRPQGGARRPNRQKKFETRIVYDDPALPEEPNKDNRNKPKKKKRKGLKTSVKITVTAAFLIVVCAVLVFAKTSAGKSAVSRFPVSFSSAVKDVVSSDSTLYVTGQTTLTTLNFSALKSQENILSFSDCMVKTSGKYALAYDRLGTSFVLYKNSNVILPETKHESGQINTAAVCENGSFAIASKCSNAASELTLYSVQGKEIFKWQCANDFIVSVAVSKNAKYLLCACINAAGGEELTRVYYFDIEKEDNNRDYTFNNTFAVDCFFAKGNRAVIVCSDRRIVLDTLKNKNAPNTVMFGLPLALRANSPTGKTFAVLKNSGNLQQNTVVCYDINNAEKFRTEVSGKIKDIVCNKNTAYVLTDKEIIKVGSKNKTESVLTSQADGIVPSGKGLYYYNSDMLYKV